MAVCSCICLLILVKFNTFSSSDCVVISEFERLLKEAGKP